jgi:hypothetical protein
MVGSLLIFDKTAWVGTIESILASDPHLQREDPKPHERHPPARNAAGESDGGEEVEWFGKRKAYP